MDFVMFRLVKLQKVRGVVELEQKCAGSAGENVFGWSRTVWLNRIAF